MCIEIKDVLIELESLGNDKRKKFNKKNGAGDNQFGVPIGKLRALGKRIGKNHYLGFKLWNTGNTDAMFLATFYLIKITFHIKKLIIW
ncbi:MAG: DNA alkylation repair protein [Clostridioides difficile]|nr:DNA alkylation repair protein [Clostridioides difficile]